MSLPDLPGTGEQNFDPKARDVFDQWKASLEAKAEGNHTHGAGGVVISIVADEAALGVGSVDGESKVTADTGRRWAWNATSESWVCSAAIIPPPGVLVTGEILGLKMVYNDASSVVIEAGRCRDELGAVELALLIDTSVELVEANIASWVADGSELLINTIYNVFITDSGLKYDTDGAGANIAGSKLFLWCVYVDSGGDIEPFDVVDNELRFRKAGGITCITNPSITPFEPDYSDFIPGPDRVEYLLLGGHATGANNFSVETYDDASLTVERSFLFAPASPYKINYTATDYYKVLLTTQLAGVTGYNTGTIGIKAIKLIR